MQIILFLLMFGLASFSRGADISGVDKVQLIVELYKRAQGLGMEAFANSNDLDRAAAERLIGKYIDFLNGRVMKIKIPLEGNQVDTFLYNRTNGAGAAEEVISNVARSQKNNPVGKILSLVNESKMRVFASRGQLGQYFVVVDATDASRPYLIAGYGDSGGIHILSGHEDDVEFRDARVLINDGKVVFDVAKDFQIDGDQILEEIQYTEENLKRLSAIDLNGIFGNGVIFSLQKRLSMLARGSANKCDLFSPSH